ncbi:MAG: M67 family metallopeptidase [Chloroflexi bacterium]|nr:M67 family metallopeptidase [Chloroflexota bacterium]
MKLSRTQYEEMVDLARRALPHEACGLLAGVGDIVREVMPLTNVEHNPVGCGWRADSREQLRAFERIDERGWELMAVFHSHPRSAAYPSERDVEHALYPDARYVITSLADEGEPVVASFRIVAGRVTQEVLTIINDVDGSGAEHPSYLALN